MSSVNHHPSALLAAERCPQCGASRAGDVAALAGPDATPGRWQRSIADAAVPMQACANRAEAGEPPQHIAPWQCPILRAALLGTIALVLLVVDMFVLWPVP
ncbi:hypothetical protein NYR97_02850 [Xanthomonas hydrangeae]|uniref:DUF2946 domain-containing protein n=1 Tax=Xanthomonas hydrangeae TaxID=2775159 RepID=A0AAU0BBH0_9XANT|nr:hypothetical protein [Xanthomonas hydrangeae]WOB50368.1 hypothetical protein NYR97_02850 [Xanthomonas hydrangeae]